MAYKLQRRIQKILLDGKLKKKKTIYIKGSLQMLNINQFLPKIFVIVY